MVDMEDVKFKITALRETVKRLQAASYSKESHELFDVAELQLCCGVDAIKASQTLATAVFKQVESFVTGPPCSSS